MAHKTITIKQSAYAKLNLLLAVTGQRPDGFHDLVSLMVPISLQDHLTVKFDNEELPSVLTSNCTYYIPHDNTIFKALELFHKTHPFKGSFHFFLNKSIPPEAGLGGASSDGVATLKAINEAIGSPLDSSALYSMATELGSDCPFFFECCPAIVRGRGEMIQKLSNKVCSGLVNTELLVFKPGFSISTPWAYDELRKHPQYYIPAPEAESLLDNFLSTLTKEKQFPAHLTVNNFEKIVFKKFRALFNLSQALKERFNIICRLSGSGSACYAFVPSAVNKQVVVDYIRECLGDIHCTYVTILNPTKKQKN